MVYLLTVGKQQDTELAMTPTRKMVTVLVVMYPGENAALWLNITEAVLGCFCSIRPRSQSTFPHMGIGQKSKSSQDPDFVIILYTLGF